MGTHQKRVARFELFKGKNGQWFGRLKGGNGEKVAQSEGYKKKESAQKWVTRLRDQVLYSSVEVVEE